MKKITDLNSVKTIAFEPNSGINRISRQTLAPSFLPNQALIRPSDLQEPIQLDQLFKLDSLNDFIESRLKPDIFDISVLQPTNFRNALKATRDNLHQLARLKKNSSRQLGRLLQLLDEQEDLSQLALMYYSALFQG